MPVLALDSSWPGLVSPYIEDVVSQFHHGPEQQGPERDEHVGQFHGGEALQLGTQGQAEGQFQQHGNEVPDFLLHVLGAVAGVKARLAASSHFYN